MEGIDWFKILILFVNYLQGTSTSLLYPFGDSEGDTRLSGAFNDEVNTSPYASFGSIYTSIDVYITGQLIIPSGRVIDVFAAISRANGAGGTVFYRDASSERSLVLRAQSEVRRINTQSTFTVTSLFIATWDGIPPVSGQLQNTYQAVLVSNRRSSFVLLLYDTIQWTSSFNELAFAGFENITLPGSGTPEISELTRNTNLVTPGLWILSVDIESPASCNLGCINGTCVDVNTCCNGNPTCDTFCDPPCVNGNCVIADETTICECATNPCLNGGTCVEIMVVDTCKCPAKFTGTFCDIKILDSTCYKEF